MIQMTADDNSLVKDLRLYAEPVEVLDPSGNVLGLFVPMGRPRADQANESAAGRIDWEEIGRRHKSETGQGRRLYEIYERLKTLTSDPKMQARLQRDIDRLRAEDGCDTP